VRTDPRIAARKVAVARDAGHRRLGVIATVLLVPACLVSLLVVLHSSLVSVHTVRIVGATHTPRGEILAVTGLDRFPPLIDVNTATAESELSALPWVGSVSVRRSWLRAVDISIVERRAVAVVALAEGDAVLDETGRVLEDVDRAPLGLARVTGVATPPAPGGFVRSADVPAFATAGAMPASLLRDVTAIDETPTKGVVVRLAEGPVAVFGTAGSLHDKFVALATLLADGAVLHGIATIDLTVPASPVLTPMTLGPIVH
jgi:cell division protein FtsQ